MQMDQAFMRLSWWIIEPNIIHGHVLTLTVVQLTTGGIINVINAAANQNEDK